MYIFIQCVNVFLMKKKYIYLKKINFQRVRKKDLEDEKTF
jgi:hypothetical protein